MYVVIKIFEKVAAVLPPLGALYKKVYKKLVEHEIRAARITRNSKVLHVGCGALPYTVSIIANETGAQTVGIDNDATAVQYAKSYFQRSTKKMPPGIQHADGTTFPFGDYDVILVSHGVKPKKQVLETIYRSLKIGGRLVYRNPKGLIGRLYNNESVIGVSQSGNLQTIKHPWIAFRESVVIEKL